MIQSRVVMGLAAVLLAACSSSGKDVSKLESSLGQTQLSLREVVSRTESRENLVSTRAKLVAAAKPSFVVYLRADTFLREVRVDAAGEVFHVANTASGPAPACSGPTTSQDALGIAESVSGGRAIQIEADDDDPCLYEVQALAGATVWEVKIDRNGTILEKEDVTNETDEDED